LTGGLFVSYDTMRKPIFHPQIIVNLLLNEDFTFTHWFILTIFVRYYSWVIKHAKHQLMTLMKRYWWREWETG